jgi:hypothetical protein
MPGANERKNQVNESILRVVKDLQNDHKKSLNSINRLETGCIGVYQVSAPVVGLKGVHQTINDRIKHREITVYTSFNRSG